MGRKIKIAKHVSEPEIRKLFQGSIHFKDKLKLLAIMNLYKGKTLIDTAEYLMLSYSNMKLFIKKWNELGLY
ncbi:MAG: hypothetical protein HOP31_12610, partial [Ignavibacteria bacterium]|nr:hypothetical protein [Ignavibacteria bacterium]